MPASVLQPRAAACSDRQRASAPSGSRRSGRTRAATITSPHCVRRLAECSKVECGMWKFGGGGLQSGRPPPLRSGELRCNVGSAGRPAAAAGAETGTGHLSTSVLATETKRTRVESKSMRSLRRSMLQRGGGTFGGGGSQRGRPPPLRSGRSCAATWVRRLDPQQQQLCCSGAVSTAERDPLQGPVSSEQGGGDSALGHCSDSG